MDPVQIASDIGRAALQITIILSLPLLVTGLVVGVVISILQAATQVQEQTLSFVPKILAMMAALYIFMPMLLRLIVDYSRESFLAIRTVPF